MMNITKIKKQFARTEPMLAKADSQRGFLWSTLLPYMSEEFHDESCYIDVAKGYGLVVVFEEKFNLVRNFPANQILDLLEKGVSCITPDNLIAI